MTAHAAEPRAHGRGQTAGFVSYKYIVRQNDLNASYWTKLHVVSILRVHPPSFCTIEFTFMQTSTRGPNHHGVALGPRFEARGAWRALWLCGYLPFGLYRSDSAKNGLDPSSTEVSGRPCSNGTLPSLAEPGDGSFTGWLRPAPHLPFQALESTSRHPMLNEELNDRLCPPVAADMLAQ
jgi:hypothetical protein